MEVETFRSLEPGWRVVRIRRHAIRQAGEHLVGLEFAVGAQQLPWQRLHHRRLDVRSGGRRVASEVKLLEALVEREGAEQRREVGVLQPTPRKVEPLSRAERRQADARARRDADRLLAAGEEAAEEEGTWRHGALSPRGGGGGRRGGGHEGRGGERGGAAAHPRR